MYSTVKKWWVWPLVLIAAMLIFWITYIVVYLPLVQVTDLLEIRQGDILAAMLFPSIVIGVLLGLLFSWNWWSCIAISACAFGGCIGGIFLLLEIQKPVNYFHGDTWTLALLAAIASLLIGFLKVLVMWIIRKSTKVISG